MQVSLDGMKKLEYITVLRALAILLVLIVHVKLNTSGIEHIHPYILSVMDSGARGVQLFYMLSAFTLFLSFNLRKSTEKKGYRNFFLRRFFRIAPLYYLAVFYYLWQDGFGPRYSLGNVSSVSSANIISNFTFINGFNPYWINSIVPGGWTIAVEALFYCSLPFLFTKIRNLQQAYNLTIATILLRFVLLMFFEHFRLISDARLWNEYLFLYFPNQLPIFAVGIVLYFVIFDKGNLKLTSKSILLGALLFIVGLAIQQDILIPGILLQAFGFFIFVIALHKYHPAIIFNNVFYYIGKISYTLYLTHLAAIYVLTKIGLLNLVIVKTEPLAFLNFFLNYLLILILSVLISTVLYFTIEMPAQKWGKKFMLIPDA